MKVKWVVAWLAVLVAGVLWCAVAWGVEEKGVLGARQTEKSNGEKTKTTWREIDPNKLSEILSLHKLWVDSKDRDVRAGGRADLRNALLKGAKLRGANLARANLHGANFYTNDLRGANFNGANLRGAVLSNADLSEAKLKGADLSGAILIKTSLKGANLQGANLDEADLWLADLKSVTFEPNTAPPKDEDGEPTGKPWWPDLTSFVEAKNFWQLVYIKDPQPITALRNKLNQDGFLTISHQLTHALRHNKGGVGWDSYIAYYLVAWPTEWGLSPLRPIAFMLLLMVFPFTLIYFLLAFPGVPSDGKNTIWRIWPNDALFRDPTIDKSGPLQLDGWGMLKFGFYFSLLSAFHIGWRDLNVGNWITRMQPREYTLRATGWVRVVSGIQSLVSVYLLALALLTYFGRPFE